MPSAITALRAAVVGGIRRKSSTTSPRVLVARASTRSDHDDEMTPDQVRVFKAAERKREKAAIAEFFDKYATPAKPASDQPQVATAQSIVAAAAKARGET